MESCDEARSSRVQRLRRHQSQGICQSPSAGRFLMNEGNDRLEQLD